MVIFIRIVIACLLLAPATVWATHPFVVEDTSTEGRGNYLFEMTGNSSKDNDLKSTTLTGWITGGLGEYANLTAEVPYIMLDPSPMTGLDEQGLGDTSIRLKHRVYENEVRQSMAYLLFADFSNGNESKGLGKDGMYWGIMFIDSQECRNNAFHLNLGYEILGRDLQDFHFLDNYKIRFGLAMEHKMTESFRFLAEFVAESRKTVDRDADTQSYARPVTVSAGIIKDISKSWYVDLGVRAGLNKYAEDYALLAGTAWRF